MNGGCIDLLAATEAGSLRDRRMQKPTLLVDRFSVPVLGVWLPYSSTATSPAARTLTRQVEYRLETVLRALGCSDILRWHSLWGNGAHVSGCMGVRSEDLGKWSPALAAMSLIGVRTPTYTFVEILAEPGELPEKYR